MKFIFLLALLSTFVLMPAHAVTLFKCEAQVVGTETGKTAPVAPSLVFFSKDSWLSSVYEKDKFVINFNPRTLETLDGVYIVLDARPKMVQMNVHLKARKEGAAVVVEMNDRVTNARLMTAFVQGEEKATATLDTDRAYMDLTCTTK